MGNKTEVAQTKGSKPALPTDCCFKHNSPIHDLLSNIKQSNKENPNHFQKLQRPKNQNFIRFSKPKGRTKLLQQFEGYELVAARTSYTYNSV